MGKQGQITHKASIAGLTKIKQRRKEKGWNLNDDRWLKSASEVLGVVNSSHLAPGISYGTWKRFLGGKKPVNEGAFKAYCQVLDLDWQQVVADDEASLTASHQDWGEAIDVSLFWGRTDEIATLKNWLVKDKCSLVLSLGMGGIGKTTLAIKVARLVQSEFDFIIWRSLRNSPPSSELLADLIQFVSQRQETNLPESDELKIDLLLKYLSSCRCLIILDNVESVLLNSIDKNNNCDRDSQAYSQLFTVLGRASHQSCLLLTSREKPDAVATLEVENTKVRCQKLAGLNLAEAKDILAAKGSFKGSEQEWQQLVKRYGGNPLALKIIAATIQDFFAGKIADFLELLEESSFISDDIYRLLQQQFKRLSSLEKRIMYWLAINREPVALTDLQSDLIDSQSISELTLALRDLQNRSLIEIANHKYTQQPVVMEYAIAELIELVTAEIIEGEIGLFNSHALVKAQVKEYVRDSQICSILQPLIDSLISVYGCPEEIERCLSRLIQQCQLTARTGYLSGNSINILRHLNCDLTGYDFSGLTIWQANLQNLSLNQVNFSDCDLSRSIFTEALGNVLAVAFSPQGDIFATANNDGKIRLWHQKTAKLQSILSGHTNWIRSVAFEPGGKTIVSGGGDRTIKLWDIHTGLCLQTWGQHDSDIYSVAFSTDGRLVASGSSDRTIKLWDIQAGFCLQTLRGHHSCVRSVAFSSDSQMLVSCSSDCTIKLWDIHTGRCQQTLPKDDSCLHSMALSPNGQILASCSSDCTIKLWDIHTGRYLKTYRGHSDTVYAIAFSPDGKTLASGSGDRTVRLWNLVTDRCEQILYGHNNQINSLDFSRDSKTLACASLDRTVKLWDLGTGKCLHTIQGHTDWAFPITFKPSTLNQPLTLAGVGDDYTVRLWNVETQDCQKIFTGHQEHIWSVVYNSEGKAIASCGAEPNIRLWCEETGECQQILVGHTDWVRSVAFHPGDRLLASSSADGTVRLWDLTTGIAAIINAPQVWSVAFNSQGNLLATGSIQGELNVWDTATQQCCYSLTAITGKGIYSVAFNPRPVNNQELVATGNTDGSLRLWNLIEGSCQHTLTGHREFISAVAFHPDGQMVASASCDRTVRLWNVLTGMSLKVLTKEENKFCSVAFSPDGEIIAAGSQNQCITLWDVTTGKYLKTIRPRRLYEGMKITRARGLTSAQQETLKTLGAIAIDQA